MGCAPWRPLLLLAAPLNSTYVASAKSITCPCVRRSESVGERSSHDFTQVWRHVSLPIGIRLRGECYQRLGLQPCVRERAGARVHEAGWVGRRPQGLASQEKQERSRDGVRLHMPSTHTALRLTNHFRAQNGLPTSCSRVYGRYWRAGWSVVCATQQSGRLAVTKERPHSLPLPDPP